MNHQRILLSMIITLSLLPALVVIADEEEAPSASIMAKSLGEAAPQAEDNAPHALRDLSMFALAPAEPRKFHTHDLVQIIVRETSRAKSKHETDAEKEYGLDAEVKAWIGPNLEDLLGIDELPKMKLAGKKEFEGEGEYKREDEFTTRLTAEVIEVLPNGNLVLESRTFIKTDAEEATIKVTGVCRSEDVTVANTVLSSQIHDLVVEKVHEGELKKANEKGLLAKFFDAIFAF